MTFDPSIREFLTAARLGVVCTIRPGGRPRQSVTYYILDGDRVLTYAELAERTGLEEGRVLAIVLGRWTPSPAERQKIAEALGVTIGDIAWGHKTPIQHLYGHGPG